MVIFPFTSSAINVAVDTIWDKVYIPAFVSIIGNLSKWMRNELRQVIVCFSIERGTETSNEIDEHVGRLHPEMLYSNVRDICFYIRTCA